MEKALIDSDKQKNLIVKVGVVRTPLATVHLPNIN